MDVPRHIITHVSHFDTCHPSALKRHSPKPSWRTATFPFQNAQFPHPIPQRHIAPPCPSHLPKKTHTPPTSTTPHRTSLSTDHPNRSGAEQTSPPRLASTNPPAHPAAPCANIYLRKKHLDLPTRHSSCASPHVRHKRDGVSRRTSHPFAFAHVPLFTSTALSSHLFWVYMNTLAS
jgi:hypothetical protein